MTLYRLIIGAGFRRQYNLTYTSTVNLHSKVQGEPAVSISEFYSGKSVLLTGCTGFLGQGVVEKLLRSCPDIWNIYVPIKPNKYGSTDIRFQQVLRYKVFDRLRTKDPDFSRKIIPFNGDITKDNIGLTGDLYSQVIDDISVIIHSAALLKLNPSLRDSVEANILGSKNVFNLAKKCRKLSAYVHVSSLFTNVELDHIKEEIYPTIKGPDEMIAKIQTESDEVLKQNEKHIIETSPVVYVYCKKVAESIVAGNETHFPTAVFRSPFITPALSDPFPAWTHGYSGFCGIMHNVNSGIIKHIAGNPENPIEMLPIDVVVNSLIGTAWFLGTGKLSENNHWWSMYRAVGITQLQIKNLSERLKTPSAAADAINMHVYQDGNIAPRLKIVPSRLELLFLNMASFILPAILKDSVALLRGEKLSYLKDLLRFRKGLSYLEMSTFSNQTKDCNNLKRVYSHLSESDKRDFPFDVKAIQWNSYLSNWIKMLQASNMTQAYTQIVSFEKQSPKISQKIEVVPRNENLEE